MAISAQELTDIIMAAFPHASIRLTDTAGDMDHYSLEITDTSFNGKSLVSQHKMVKDALRNVINTKLHAITIKTIVGPL